MVATREITLNGSPTERITMRDFFLYIRYDFEHSNIFDGIYSFNNNLIIAVDTAIYHTKKSRLEIEKQLSLNPYYITQLIFDKFLEFAFSKDNTIKLLDIYFIDDYDDEKSSMDFKFDYDNCYSKIKDIETETEIDKIVFLYRKGIFTISSMGCLSVEAPDSTMADFVNQHTINQLLLGR